ncbi:MAG: type II toxin-antitoxin system HicA family toxin [Oscillospiraceae bacterium]|nr:type II toxin-antitoxin system HicA family toxin [Oscillospiraceae bacterium]
MPMLPKEMIKHLETNGFIFVKSNGSHRKFFNPTTGKTTVIPYHNKQLKPGTEKAILKQAGLEKLR